MIHPRIQLIFDSVGRSVVVGVVSDVVTDDLVVVDVLKVLLPW